MQQNDFGSSVPLATLYNQYRQLWQPGSTVKIVCYYWYEKGICRKDASEVVTLLTYHNLQNPISNIHMHYNQ